MTSRGYVRRVGPIAVILGFLLLSPSVRAVSRGRPVAISLNDVVGITTDDVWAVGNGTDSQDPDNTDPAFEHWDGTRWRLVPGQRTPEDDEQMLGVAAVNGADVWAVGSVGQRLQDNRQIEIQHWDGHAWSFVEPFHASGNDVLEGVAAVSSDDVWGVGSRETGGGVGRDRALVEHWDGQQWRAVAIPDPTGPESLTKVAAVSKDDVWAVGSQGPEKLRPLAMHWNGSRWSLLPLPPLTPDAKFTDVVAVAADDVWAVGFSFNPSIPSISHPLTEHWDGKAWTIVPSVDTGRTNSDGLAAVSAVSSDDVWTVGNFVDDGERTLTEHWNGAAWSRVPAPRSFLMNSVAAVAPDDVWAVGWMISSSIIQHWDGSRWSVVPSP